MEASLLFYASEILSAQISGCVCVCVWEFVFVRVGGGRERVCENKNWQYKILHNNAVAAADSWTR